MDTFVTSFEEIGRAEGRVEGRAEGRIEGRAEGQRDIVLRLLNRKVGALTEELHVQISRLSPESLLTLSEALLDFTDQSDLIAWLERNASQGAS